MLQWKTNYSCKTLYTEFKKQLPESPLVQEDPEKGNERTLVQRGKEWIYRWSPQNEICLHGNRAKSKWMGEIWGSAYLISTDFITETEVMQWHGHTVASFHHKDACKEGFFGRKHACSRVSAPIQTSQLTSPKADVTTRQHGGCHQKQIPKDVPHNGFQLRSRNQKEDTDRSQVCFVSRWKRARGTQRLLLALKKRMERERKGRNGNWLEGKTGTLDFFQRAAEWIKMLLNAWHR